MTKIGKINFIIDHLTTHNTREIQVLLKNKFGSGVNNNVIKGLRTELKEEREKRLEKEKDNKKDNEDNKKITRKKGKDTPTHGELIDAYILLHEIKKNFKADYEAHKVKYAAEFKRYVKYKYKNYAAFTEVVNDHFENLKITMELIK